MCRENNMSEHRGKYSMGSREINKLFLPFLLTVPFLFIGCTGGETEDSLHNQGKSCLSCHRSGSAIEDDHEGEDEEVLISGGTVYTTIDAADTENLAGGYRIRLLFQDDSTINFEIDDESGTANSSIEDEHGYSLDLTNPYTAQVINSSGSVVNSSLSYSHDVARLDCNYCHTADGKVGAPGRITSYDYYNTPVDENITITDTNETNITGTLSFANHVMPVLETKCKACHKTSGLGGNFIISDVNSTYDNITTNNFSLLTKGSGTAHLGGKVIPSGSTDYTTLESWISQGSLNN